MTALSTAAEYSAWVAAPAAAARFAAPASGVGELSERPCLMWREVWR